MKKFTFSILFIYCFTLNAQFNDVDPHLNSNANNYNSSSYSSPNSTEFLYDIGTTIGANGNAGVVFINNQFWVSAWASGNIHVLSNTGAFVETFTIDGVTGIRSFTTDGTNVYAGTNVNTILVINPITKTLINTITTSLPHTVRFLTYDSSLNGGLGGFWTGNFNTDLIAISMTGSSLLTIPAATHGLSGMYGAAVNSATNTLYIYCQMPPYNDTISSLTLPTGISTGLVYDVFTSELSAGGTTSSLAGGTFLSNTVVPGQTILMGVSQATPQNMLWGINVNNLLGIENFGNDNFNIYPNPIQSSISFKEMDFDNFSIFTIEGKEILSHSSTELNNNAFDISKLNSGVYILSIKKGEQTKNYKIIKE